jgi:hypothetical protein
MKSDNDVISKVLLGVVSAKFGPGAIGRIGTFAIAVIVVLALLAIVFSFKNIYVAGAIAVLDVLFALYALHKVTGYAERHPELAAMDGAQISKLLTHQASMKPLEGVPPPPPYIEATVPNPMIATQEEGA